MLKTIVFTPAVGSPVTLHAEGVGSYAITRADGIIGTPATRDVEKVAPGRHGVLSDTRFLDGRTIVLEGEIFGTSTSDVLTKWDTITQAFQTTLLKRGTLTVTRADNTSRQCEVVLSGTAEPSLSDASNFLAYQITLRAPDPRWYSTTLHSVTLSKSYIAGGTWAAGNYAQGTIVKSGTGTSTKNFLAVRAVTSADTLTNFRRVVDVWGNAYTGAGWAQVAELTSPAYRQQFVSDWSATSTITNAGNAPTGFTVTGPIFRFSVKPPTGFEAFALNGNDFQVRDGFACNLDTGDDRDPGGLIYVADDHGDTLPAKVEAQRLLTGLASANTTNRTFTLDSEDPTITNIGVGAATEWPNLYPGDNVCKFASLAYTRDVEFAATASQSADTATVTWRDAWL